MPGFDRTGPAGAGAMTGGGRGRCASANRRATDTPSSNLGRGRPLGRGGMWRRRGPRGYDFEAGYAGQGDDLQQLRREARLLEERLQQINDRIDLQSQQSSE